MLKTIEVTNFQSLRKARVDLGTLTVIVGPNDLGKSALFRAVRAAAEAATGTGFITYGENLAVVSLEFDDGTLTWRKGEGINQYVLGEQTFDRIGREVPPDVRDFLALSPVEYSKSLKLNLNFADQDDPPFLIPFPGGISGADVAKVLGDLTNLNVLYLAVGESERERRSKLSLKTVREGDRQTTLMQLERFATIDQQERRVSRLEALVQECSALIGELETLEAFRTQLEVLESEEVRLQQRLEALGPDIEVQVVELEQELRAWNHLKELHLQIEGLRTKYVALDGQAQTASANREAAEAFKEQIMGSIKTCPICERPMEPAHAH
jgi:DNA repair exonuclease SbcCD ATPase subunit